MDFKIGDKIEVVSYEKLPIKRRNKGVARACGKEGVIIDKLYSGKENRYIYKVQLHAYNEPSSISFTDDMLMPAGGGRYPFFAGLNRAGRRCNRNVQRRHKDQEEFRAASVRRRVRRRAGCVMGCQTAYAEL